MNGNGSIDIAFGRSHLAVTMPADAEVQVIRKRPLPKLADPRAAVRAALDTPVGARPLRELARGAKSACILICDITRPVPNDLFLRPMIEDSAGGGHPGRGHHHPGRHRTASAQRRRRNWPN